MGKILTFFNDLFAKKNLFIFILIIAVVLLVMLNLNTCNGLKEQKAAAKQNEEAMKKELVVEKNKSGFLQTSVVAFEGSTKDLKKYSNDLEKEVGDLKNRKPEVIVKTQIVYVGDTLTTKNTLVNEGNGYYDLNWNFENADSSRIIKGKSTFSAKMNILSDKTYSLNILHGSTSLLQDDIKLDFVVGVAHNKKTGFDEVFVTPKNTNVHVGKLEGAILNKPKPKYLSISAQAGYGVVYGSGVITLGPYVGVGLSYNLMGLFKK
jgi:hypothetical protein